MLQKALRCQHQRAGRTRAKAGVVVEAMREVGIDISGKQTKSVADMIKSGQTFAYVILPNILPAALTGFALAFARALGEYGSVIFIAGNMPMVSEITPLLIITKLEQYDYKGATAIAVVMLSASFLMLFAINLLQAWMRRRGSREPA